MPVFLPGAISFESCSPGTDDKNLLKLLFCLSHSATTILMNNSGCMSDPMFISLVMQITDIAWKNNLVLILSERDLDAYFAAIPRGRRDFYLAIENLHSSFNVFKTYSILF